jgi:hypothetical protein
MLFCHTHHSQKSSWPILSPSIIRDGCLYTVDITKRHDWPTTTTSLLCVLYRTAGRHTVLTCHQVNPGHSSEPAASRHLPWVLHSALKETLTRCTIDYCTNDTSMSLVPQQTFSHPPPPQTQLKDYYEGSLDH